MAAERRRVEIRRARHDWLTGRQPIMRRMPERLVFIDGETEQKSIRWIDFPTNAVKTDLTRLRGRAPVGQRLAADAPFGRWRTQTFIAGLAHDGPIAPWVIEGAMNGAAFATHVETRLAPALAPGTAVILDTLSTHRNERAAAALRERGCRFLFLPPYSPDPNPIEQAYAKLKAMLRKVGARPYDQLVDALGQICDLFTPEECRNFFRHAAYAST